MIQICRDKWSEFEKKHENSAQFLLFFILSNGITILQIVMMPTFRTIFEGMGLLEISFQIGQIGQNFDGSQYFIFNYPMGDIASGGGGGLAYFLAVQVTMAIAQIINFFVQRNVTFKSKSNIWTAAFWYAIAYVLITIGAAAAQGFYRAPVYEFFINTLSMGALGETIADGISMLINCAISFWVFFPIFKVIFKQEK